MTTVARRADPQGDREWMRRGAVFVAAMMTEPHADAVDTLAAFADGDADHARWELRYLRRALGLLIAGRDALDDRTASLVGQALARAVEQDPAASPSMRAVSAGQFNARLRVYRDLVGQRGAARTPVGRIGEALVGFAGGRPGTDADDFAAGWVASELDRCNEALRQAFGTAELPEDVAPSATVAPRR